MKPQCGGGVTALSPVAEGPPDPFIWYHAGGINPMRPAMILSTTRLGSTAVIR
jgi:hypothetical protein